MRLCPVAIAVGATVAALSVPAAASGATFCVQKPGCGPAETFQELQGALTAAGANGPSNDRVEIGPVALAAADSTSPAGSEVDIVGSGVDGTTLTGAASANGTTLTLTDTDSSISALAIRPGAAADTTGLELGGSASGLTFTAVDATPGG